MQLSCFQQRKLTWTAAEEGREDESALSNREVQSNINYYLDLLWCTWKHPNKGGSLAEQLFRLFFEFPHQNEQNFEAVIFLCVLKSDDIFMECTSCKWWGRGWIMSTLHLLQNTMVYLPKNIVGFLVASEMYQYVHPMAVDDFVRLRTWRPIEYEIDHFEDLGVQWIEEFLAKYGRMFSDVVWK